MLGVGSVRGRIIVGFSFLMLLLAAAAAVSFLRVQSNQSHLDNLDDVSAAAIALERTQVELTLQTQALQGYIASRDVRFVTAFRDSFARVQGDIEEARVGLQASGDSGQLAALDSLAQTVEQISIQSEELLLLATTGEVEQAATIGSEVESAVEGLGSTVETIVAQQRGALRSETDSAALDVQIAFWALVAFGLITILAAGAWARGLAQSVLRPIAAVRASARAIASGDFAARPQVTKPKELALLTKDLDRMIVRLIKEGESGYRRLVETSPDLVFTVDLRQGLTYANWTCQRVTGYTFEELSSSPSIAGKIVHPEHWRPFVGLWNRLCLGDIPTGPQLVRLVGKEGQEIWLAQTFAPVRDGQGRVTAIEVAARDVTLLRFLMKEVRRRDEQLRLLLGLSQTVASSIAFEDVASKGLDAVIELLPQIEAAFLMAYDSRRDLLQVSAVRGLDQKLMSRVAAKPGQGLLGRVFQSGEAEAYLSPRDVAGVAASSEPQGADSFEEVLKRAGLPQSLICVPLHAGNGRLGCLTVVTFTEGASFQQSDVAFLQAIATQVATFLENVWLRAEAELREITDSLTGLYTHAYFHQRLAEEIERSKRYAHNFALLMVDITNFKSYNEAAGHAAGDQVLRIVGDAVRSQLRRSDVACRYGADEFACILVQADLPRVERVLQRIANSLASKLQELESEAAAKLGLSSGTACFPDDGTTVDELVRVADAALYSAKLSASRETQTAQASHPPVEA